MKRDLTKGSELKAMLAFSLPLMIGNLLQQAYNVVDTLIVGQFLGGTALAAVGSSYTLMVFITSISLGFCMGSGVVFSQLYGAKQMDDLRSSLFNSFLFIGLITIVLNILCYLLLDPLMTALNIQPAALEQTKTYLRIIFAGLMFTFIYNFFAAALRSVGNSVTPLIFLAISAVINIVLDIVFVVPLAMGVGGAALATIIAQGVSAVGVAIYFYKKAPDLRPQKQHMRVDRPLLKRIINNSVLTSVQQSIMNFGILLVQGLVNGFGIATMAAFAAAVKIDSFAYMPVQDFGNAFSTYVAQNYGAGKADRIKKGTRQAAWLAIGFCVVISLVVCIFARPLMLLFVQPTETEILRIGVEYLRIEGTFYVLIGLLFLLYGYYRGMGRPGMSVVLTVLSLGTRVVLSYVLAGTALGARGIWISIPIGWALADLVGIIYYFRNRKKLLRIPAR